jgi:hypothetical protein
MGFIGDALGTNTNSSNFQNVVDMDPAKWQSYKDQSSFLDALKTKMNGQGPSLAGNMLQQQNENNAAMANAQIAATRGVNPGMALRQGLMTNAAADQQTAQQASNARLQEETQAQKMYGDELNAQQGQRIQALTAQNADNTGISEGNAKNNSDLVGGVIKGIGGGIAAALAKGGVVPGHPHVSGDSYQNDTVKILASPGEEVLPRSITMAPDAPERAKRFVAALQARMRASAAPAPTSYAHIIAARRGLRGGI